MFFSWYLFSFHLTVFCGMQWHFKGKHSTGCKLWTAEGAGLLAALARSTCCGGHRQAGGCPRRCGMAGRARQGTVSLPAPPEVWSHPSPVWSAGSLRMLCDSRAARVFMLYCYTVKTVKLYCWDNSQCKALPGKPQGTATSNNNREFRVHKTRLHC